MFIESVGPNSKCVDFEIRTNWEFNSTTISPIYGGACYEVCARVCVYVCVCVRACVHACMHIRCLSIMNCQISLPAAVPAMHVSVAAAAHSIVCECTNFLLTCTWTWTLCKGWKMPNLYTSATVTSDGCFIPCRSPVLQKAMCPLKLDRLRSFVKVQDKRWVCYTLIHRGYAVCTGV